MVRALESFTERQAHDLVTIQEAMDYELHLLIDKIDSIKFELSEFSESHESRANINEPETINNKTLYFSIKNNLGKVVNKEATIGPPPNNSKNAGKAQQMHILTLVTRLVAVKARALFGLG